MNWLREIQAKNPLRRATDPPPEPPPLPVQERIEEHAQPVREPKVETYQIAVKAPEDHQTAADVIDYLCKKYGGTYERFLSDDSGVSVAMNFSDGERIVGRGKTTADAVKALHKRLEK